VKNTPYLDTVDTKSPTHNDLVKYTLSNGVEVTSTFDHPFYVNKMELASHAPKLTNERYELGVNVRKIEKGDCVYMIPKDGGIGMHAVAISKVEPQPLADTQTYIFTVEDNHNFYANGILTHNK
jgi:intein/homing endonuclease